MLVFGLVGSALVLGGDGWAVAGFACLFVYYVLDCVDGEVARFRKAEKLVWGFYDFLFHLAVKTAFFVCLGVYAWRTTGSPWMFGFGLSALLSVLFLKFLLDVPLVLAARHVVERGGESSDRFAREILAGATPADLEAEADPPGEEERFEFRGFLPTLRAVLTNFDLASILFLVAGVLDLFMDPFPLWGVQVDLKVTLLAFYGLVLPVDFLDRLQSHLRERRFITDARRLLRRANRFRLPR